MTTARPPQPPRTPAVQVQCHSPTNGAAQLLTAGELGARWQVPKGHVYRLTREGLIPAVRIGRYYRYRLGAIEAFELEGGVAADD